MQSLLNAVICPNESNFAQHNAGQLKNLLAILRCFEAVSELKSKSSQEPYNRGGSIRGESFLIG